MALTTNPEAHTIYFQSENMVSSFSCSSSSFKKSHKATTTTSLNSLPNELLVEISLCVASSSLSEIRNLQLVSKSFQRFCNDRYVFHRLTLREIPLFPWHHHNRQKFSTFFKRCLKNQNPEALYRKGLIDCFRLDNDEQGNIYRGIKYLSEAAKKGNQEAQYVYGMILICLGDKTKQKGFKILSSLIKPLMSSTIKELEKVRQKILDNVLWRGKPTMRKLKGIYVQENCNCDGRTKTFLAKTFLRTKNCFSNGYGENNNNDMVTASACEICLWHHQAQLFFDDI